MAAQIQCPNCGGYRVSFRSKRMTGQTTNRIPLKQHLLKAGMVFITLTAFGLLFLYLAQSNSTGFADVLGTLAIFIFIFEGMVFLLFVPTLFNIEDGYVITTTRTGETTVTHRCSCDLCGYKWQWTEGTPQPAVTVRPDLIAAGEERRQKAAAAAYLDKQRKRK